ncbi:MAG: PQQ-dependent sugar dehydrogenase [Candidatus Eisenbacteria bacterium]
MSRPFLCFVVPVLFGLLLAPAAHAEVTTELVATDLAWPVFATAPEGDDRLFIVEQRGVVRVWKEGALLAEPFLDIDSLVAGVSQFSERGLLGLAFDPAYDSTGHFFVNYTNNAGTTIVARYTVQGTDPDKADHSSAEIVLTQSQPFSNHNGGMLAFGSDGYLYIGFGDGGAGGDPNEVAQNLLEWLGKILRIDVGSLPYSTPPDNPFFGNPNARDEIWALGVRNPWRFGFDRATGDLWIADVGQGSYEEIDFQPASSPGGENYGWDNMEGFHCYEPPVDCGADTLVLPIHEYDHSAGNCSVTGGYRYRGSLAPELAGLYLFGDYCSNRIWAMEWAGDSVVAITSLTAELNSDGQVSGLSAFGEDGSGELYMVSRGTGLNGKVFRIVPGSTGIGGAESLPSTLRLGSPMPNPFANSTRFDLGVNRPGEVTVRVYDVAGREVRRLESGFRGAGTGAFEWDGRNSSDREMPSGVYFVRAERGDAVTTRRVHLIR